MFWFSRNMTGVATPPRIVWDAGRRPVCCGVGVSSANPSSEQLRSFGGGHFGLIFGEQGR